MIEVNGLVKRFDGFAALDGAALSGPAGRVHRPGGPQPSASTAWWVPTAPVSPP